MSARAVAAGGRAWPSPSSTRMLAKAATLSCDQLFMDLEDAVAPSHTAAVRDHAVEARRTIDWRRPHAERAA